MILFVMIMVKLSWLSLRQHIQEPSTQVNMDGSTITSSGGFGVDCQDNGNTDTSSQEAALEVYKDDGWASS